MTALECHWGPSCCSPFHWAQVTESGGGGSDFCVFETNTLSIFKYAGVMRCGAAEATGLGFVFLLLSTLVCCQPTELIWAFMFHQLSFFFLPPPLPPGPDNTLSLKKNTIERTTEITPLAYRDPSCQGGECRGSQWSRNVRKHPGTIRENTGEGREYEVWKAYYTIIQYLL